MEDQHAMDMPLLSPLVVEVTAPFAGRCVVALSTDPADCRLILQRLAERKRREARDLLDPGTAAVILTEADRFEKLLALVAA
jgi:hypothetical protein